MAKKNCDFIKRIINRCGIYLSLNYAENYRGQFFLLVCALQCEKSNSFEAEQFLLSFFSLFRQKNWTLKKLFKISNCFALKKRLLQMSALFSFRAKNVAILEPIFPTFCVKLFLLWQI